MSRNANSSKKSWNAFGMLAVGKVLAREQAIVPVLPWKSNDFLDPGLPGFFVQGLGSKNWIFFVRNGKSIPIKPKW